MPEDGWQRKGEYWISTARCPTKGVLRTVENREFWMMKCGGRRSGNQGIS